MNLIFRGEIGDNQSWGISTIGNVQGFLKAGVNVTLDATNRYGDVPKEVLDCITTRHYPYDVFIRQGLAKHMDELATINAKLVRISLSCWDSDLVDEAIVQTHNFYADGILALSEFTKKAFVDAGVTIPIHVGGQGFDENIFYPSNRIKSNDDFTFITVAVAQGRKGTHALIRAFEKALGNVKGAKLIIKSNSWGHLRDFGVKCDNIEKLYKEHTREDMGTLYRDCDCFVLPTEGDSFALPGIESMACGLPLIITDFGGPRDYCTDETGYRIKCTLKDAGYLPGHQAVPDEDHLAELFTHVFENQKEARAKGAVGAIKAKEYWTWTKDAERNRDFLQKLINIKRGH